MRVQSMHFRERAGQKLADARLQKNLKKLSEKFVTARASAITELDDFEGTRDAAVERRNRALDRLDLWLEIFERYDMEKYGSDGGPLHDPTVIAYLLEPGLFKGRHINVEIETGSELTLGMTVADWWRVTGREPNAMFMGSVDRQGFYRLLTERLGRL